MKRVLTLTLALLMIFSLAACNGSSASKDLGPEVVEKKDYSRYAGIVHDPKTWYDEFMALPVANAEMTTDELRQLCIDAFKANMTFHWTPNQEINYTYKLLGKSQPVTIPVGLAYSGLFYATGIPNTSRGNIYKMLNYYDHETGVVDVEAMGHIDVIISNLSSACGAGAQQAWNRVCNNTGIVGMQYSMYETNVVPVGSYTYEPADYKNNFITRTASNEIIAKNGNDVMYESLAQMLPADGLYSSSSWHVMMCSQKPVVEYFPDGKINPFTSYLHVHEQGSAGTNTTRHDIIQPNGRTLRQLGTIDNKYTFDELINLGYIPFTLKEFIGEDPIESGEAWIGKNDKKAETADMTILQLNSLSICTNYVLCTAKIQVKAPDGTVLVSYTPMVNSSMDTYSYTIMGLLDSDRLTPYANGKNTLHIYAQLANGELVEAYNGLLVVE